MYRSWGKKLEYLQQIKLASYIHAVIDVAMIAIYEISISYRYLDKFIILLHGYAACLTKWSRGFCMWVEPAIYYKNGYYYKSFTQLDYLRVNTWLLQLLDNRPPYLLLLITTAIHVNLPSYMPWHNVIPVLHLIPLFQSSDCWLSFLTLVNHNDGVVNHDDGV